jgi:putative ABC transport system permease protein
MTSLLTDIRDAIRLLRDAPAFALSVVAVLAVGIGANASVFSALDQTVVRPLPYANPDRLAMVWEDFSAFGTPKNDVSPATFSDWKRRTQAFSDLAAFHLSVMNLSEAGAPERVVGVAATANLLPLLGVSPLLGRVLSADEEPPGHRVVVLSHRLWQRRFSGDRNIVGASIAMNGERHVVVGVMPPGFHFPDAGTDFWAPIALSAVQLTARNSHYLNVVGRLRETSSWAIARADMSTIARTMGREFPTTNDRVGITVTPLKEEITAGAGHALGLLLGAAACVLLIACANVANLLLARASRRQREIAVRLALGATRARVVRQLLTESLLLSSAGGVAALVVAHWSLTALTHFVPPELSASIDLHLDSRAMIFMMFTTAVTALAFGWAPATRLSSTDVSQSLKPSMGAGGDRRGKQLRRTLVVGEIAIAVVLTVGAALLVETLVRLRAVDPGFRTDRMLTGELVVPYPKYHDANKRIQFYADVLARVRALPGIERVGLTSDLPYTTRDNYMSLKIEHQERLPDLGQDALFRLVSTDYLQTIGAKLQAGRFLDDRDQDGSLPVVVINEALAREYWRGASPLGHRIDTGTGGDDTLWMTIIGVVRDINERGVDFGPKPAVYVPFTQTAISFFQPSSIAIRASVPPTNLANSLQHAVWAIDPEQPVSNIRTMDDIVDHELANRRQTLALLGVFAGVALLLAALGVYGVLSYLVSESRREIGLRMAIGASRGIVIGGILRYSAGLTAAGIALGLAAALATTRLLGSLLFDVSPIDPTVLISVSGLLAMISLMASYLPARRASLIDPMMALRTE